MKRIERIVESRSALEEFHERAAALAPGDAAGWATLARWAAERDLVTQSREAWQRVLAADPAHPEANAALGRVELDGEWVSEDEAYRARGYVEYEGRWVTPAEHEALVRERAAEEASARERREAELRVREAEARAREAEARAARGRGGGAAAGRRRRHPALVGLGRRRASCFPASGLPPTRSRSPSRRRCPLPRRDPRRLPASGRRSPPGPRPRVGRRSRQASARTEPALLGRQAAPRIDFRLIFAYLLLEEKVMYMTRRQKEILDFLNRYIERKGYAPTIEETAEHFGLRSLATVHKHLTNLQKKGLVKRDWNRSRALELVPTEVTVRAVELPLLGRVAAGSPIEAITASETIFVPEDMVGRRETYVLQVKGDSMIEEQIRDGDYVIVENRRAARDGEMVIALLDGESVTLKKMYREGGGKVRLQPANARLKPIFVDQDRLRIQGVVIGVLRKY